MPLLAALRRCTMTTTMKPTHLPELLPPDNPWDVLRCVETAIPHPSSREILLRVHAMEMKSGQLNDDIKPACHYNQKAAIPETDQAGTVLPVAGGIQPWTQPKGGTKYTELFPQSHRFRRDRGALREYKLLKAANMYHSLYCH